MENRSKSNLWRLGAAVGAAVLLLGVLAIAAQAGPVGTAQGFEDDDGNLINNAAAGIDWNTFAPTIWSPHPATTPTRTTSGTSGGFKFAGFEDWQATTSDSGFAGGTKQDTDCPSVITQKADNKADLKRIYVASTRVGSEIYLDLAWVRIPQNTTSPSAHVAFEFNQGTTACPAGSDSLVRRSTANGGDMLVVYDFEGGSTDVPHITLRRWVGSGSCEISSDSPPCWGPASDLTTLGFAEAKVNTFGSVQDDLTPPALSSATGTSVTSTLGTSEFGEAGIDLGPNGANVFPSGTCVSFGKVYGVSRTSGNSGTAQMKDLVGPGNFRLSNCGNIVIIKHTDPRGIDQNFGYTTTGGLTPSTFTLNDSGNSGGGDSTGNTQDYGGTVQAGTYTVTEGADPSGFVFESLSCVDSSGNSTTTSGKTATITVVGDGSTTCTYVNQQQLGAIKISKTSSKTGNALAGAHFSITGPNSYSNSVVTGSDGTVCVDGLAFGAYTVTETQAPTGFVIDDSSGHSVTVDNNAKCSDSPYGGETTSFTDTPTADIQVNFRDGGSGETSGTITCDNTTGTGSDTPASGWDTSRTVTGIHAPTTVTCTIVIDP
jgi:hypothetical protein